MQENMFADIDFSNFCDFIFKESPVFIEREDDPSEKIVVEKIELDGIDIDSIENLEGLPRISVHRLRLLEF